MNNFRLLRNRPNIRGALHADEVSYYFKHSFGPIPDRQSMEFTAVQRFVSDQSTLARSHYILKHSIWFSIVRGSVL